MRPDPSRKTPWTKNHHLDEIEYPLLKSQMAGGAIQHVASAGEWTGSVYCFPRRSSLAVMRCAEYQHTHGCACPNAVTVEQIEMVLENRSATDEGESNFLERFPDVPRFKNQLKLLQSQTRHNEVGIEQNRAHR